jgi:chromosome partitioning protein
MTILTFASSKGGVGKSTLTGHLAAEAERHGAGPVAIVDCDPQGSLAEWWNSRAADTPLFARADVRRLRQDLEALARQGIALVIIDTPPALLDVITAAIAAADLVVIPCRPSPHDLRTVGAVLELCQKAHKPHVMVLNAVTARSRLAVDAAEVLRSMAPALKTVIHQRQLFASSMIDGRTAGELEPRSTAAAEITALWHELATHLGLDGKESDDGT